MERFTEDTALPVTEAPFAGDSTGLSPAQLQNSVRRLRLLVDLAHQVCAETDERAVFDSILSAVVKLLQIERAFVATVVDGRLVARACHGIELPGDVNAWPVSRTMLRRALDERVALLTTDAMQDARFGGAPSVDLHSLRSVMCCPFGYPHEPTGLIYADNRLVSSAFDRADLEFLRTLAHYAAVAVLNAQERQILLAQRDLAEARLATLTDDHAGLADLIGSSPALVKCYGNVKRVAPTEVPVLILGETGTGKELLARAVHQLSARAGGPFIPVNISAFPTTTVESELFGHEKGAFTGADRRRIGRFELAEHGTLFLDEILDIPAEVQPKLLRVLEQRTFQRLGGNEVLRADVRIVCACNKDPRIAVAEGRLREDLFYRLNAVTIELPPLRERPEDVEPLVRYFLGRCESRKVFDQDALNRLRAYRWPGNVRELRNCVEGLNALSEGPHIRAADLPTWMCQSAVGRELSGTFEPLTSLIARLEKEHILRAIERAEGNNEEAIRLLKISRAKFFERKRDYGLL